MKSVIDPKHKQVFIQNFMKKIEDFSLKLNQYHDTEPSKYVTTRYNWVMLIRTFIQRFDYMHIPVEDLKRYDEKNNLKVSVVLDPDKVTHELVVNSHQQIWQIVV